MSVFSHSRIESFETCPKKYEFAYVLRVPRGPSGIEAFMGSRVHEALEWLYREVGACRLPSEEDVVERYLALWEAEYSEDVAVVRPQRTAEDYRNIGELAVRRYYRRYHPFDQGVTVGLEMRIGLTLDDEHEMTGFVDSLVKVSDGVWEIHDYKTSSTLMEQEKADRDRQLALYALAVREMYADAEQVSLVWHFVTFDHEVRSCRTPEQLEGLRTQVLEQVRHIESQTEFPTKVSSLCDWCDYKPICPAWRHQFEATALPPDEFAAESGVALVDEYVRVSDDLSALEKRRDALKDAIASRAADEGLERLFGTEYAIKVFRYRGVALPDAKDPRRAELEQVLRDHGLLERFSQMATFQLCKAIEAGELPEAAAAAVAPYATPTEGVRLYPRKVT
jgi:putative RecB family exonuclease